MVCNFVGFMNFRQLLISISVAYVLLNSFFNSIQATIQSAPHHKCLPKTSLADLGNYLEVLYEVLPRNLGHFDDHFVTLILFKTEYVGHR